MQTLRNLKEFPLKNFLCLSDGYKDSLKNEFYFLSEFRNFSRSFQVLNFCFFCFRVKGNVQMAVIQ